MSFIKSFFVWKDKVAETLKSHPAATARRMSASLEGLWYKGTELPYHNYAHLLFVAERQEKLFREEGLELREEDVLAALFHDFGYDPAASGFENIQKTVELTEMVLVAMGTPQGSIDKVLQLIRATEHHISEDPYARLLIKADLCALAFGEAHYGWYAGAIRQEYQLVPRDKYIKGRLQALEVLVQLCVTQEYFSKEELRYARKELRTLRRKSTRRPTAPRALYAGSFDPFHKGHLHVIREAIRMGYEVHVAVMTNPSKIPTIPAELRLKLIKNDLCSEGLFSVYESLVDNSEADTIGIMASRGCSVLLRGVREDDPSSVVEERNRAAMIKAEVGIETVLVPSSGYLSSFSSSSSKTLVSYGYPAKMLSPVTRVVYDMAINPQRGKPLKTLVIGGIATGKSTYISKMLKGKSPAAVTIDLDTVAKKYLSRHPVFGKETAEERLSHYKSLSGYQGYMNKIRPIIMAGLHQELSELPLYTTEEVYIMVNKMGAIQDDLLRMCNYRVHYLKDISYEEAVERVKERGSRLDTMELVRALECHAPTAKELQERFDKIVSKATSALVGFSREAKELTNLGKFRVKEI